MAMKNLSNGVRMPNKFMVKIQFGNRFGGNGAPMNVHEMFRPVPPPIMHPADQIY